MGGGGGGGMTWEGNISHISLRMSLVLTFHDLLDFHLEGDDLSDCGVIHIAVNAVNGQTAILDRCHIIVFQEDHLVGVLDYGTS